MLLVILLELAHGLVVDLLELLLIFLINFILNFFPCELFVGILKLHWLLGGHVGSSGTFSWSGLSLELWWVLLSKFVHRLLLRSLKSLR